MAAHEGVRAVRRAGLDSGRLSAVLLPGIQERLEAIRAEAAHSQPDGARLYRGLVDLFGAFGELAENAARYMRDLAVETSVLTTNDESFDAYKRAVFMYLNEFVSHLADAVPSIAGLITGLDADMARLVELASAADATPTATGPDDTLERSFAGRWSGVRAWFVSDGDTQPISASLRLAMLDALNRILSAVGQLHERHLRRVTREADFTQLAGWFATAEGEGASLLWDRSFGLYPARHFAELAGDEDDERGRSFWDAAPVELAPRLRATGTRAGPGRPGRASDYSAAKAAGLQRLRAQRRRMEEALGRLAVRTPTALSRLGPLDTDEFAQFLAVLTAALGARPDANGARWASTPLGKVTLRPLPRASGPARIEAPYGTFGCEDQLIEIRLAGQASRRALG